MGFDIMYLIAAFGGGLFGAAIGGLPTFILCGLVAIAGAGIAAATGNGAVSGTLAFGPILGPHVAFAGGVAGAVYAYSKGKLASGRDIATPLISLGDPMVLIIGGIWGVIGYVLMWAIGLLQIGGIGATNNVACSVAISAVLARLVFGKTGLFGKVRAGDNRWRASDVGNWLPWQTDPITLLVIGLGLGLAVSWTTLQVPASAGMWFGVSAAALVLLQVGVKVPVWHHIVLAAEQAIAVGGGDFWWGVAFAILGAFLGEFMAMLFTSHADSHIDPPACSLFVTFTLMAILRSVGAFKIAGIGSLIIALAVAVIGYAITAAMKSKPNAAVAPAKA